jgi:hypothetical protein
MDGCGGFSVLMRPGTILDSSADIEKTDLDTARTHG